MDFDNHSKMDMLKKLFRFLMKHFGDIPGFQPLIFALFENIFTQKDISEQNISQKDIENIQKGMFQDTASLLKKLDQGDFKNFELLKQQNK